MSEKSNNLNENDQRTQISLKLLYTCFCARTKKPNSPKMQTNLERLLVQVMNGNSQ